MDSSLLWTADTHVSQSPASHETMQSPQPDDEHSNLHKPGALRKPMCSRQEYYLFAHVQ